jgi:hypothetical protein
VFCETNKVRENFRIGEKFMLGLTLGIGAVVISRKYGFRGTNPRAFVMDCIIVAVVACVVNSIF